MQRSWREDNDKLTFILCLPDAAQSSPADHTAEIVAMVGDVNMFIACHEDDDGLTSLVGELELMVALRRFQRQGLGRAGLLCFLAYIKDNEKKIVQQYTNNNIGPRNAAQFDYLTAKIGESNERSLRLFESLGFARTSDAPNYFGEFELRLKSLSRDVIRDQMQKYNINDYQEIEYKDSVNEQQTSLGGPE